ncbi:hypothetical protein M409DRAFT_62133 [Zasmidium cellare ATCC 36951]|uniref:Glycosyltransferase 2-like domain-containing protein n=1 Tax=Zasmidium cellare ATCC 36951 TaxID=1080233 RepID=A0A6A6D4D0_ZASCE|nr:uncharacterized protein M409DRAFT_62133 [Zasmidium cellare ATCC 36951]KAF2173915.1 hypothetical protein M409DRAFT_62133 [Zasmidium cellare ATCC 36951]
MAGTYVWLTRCIPGFSVVGVFVLLVSALVISPYGKGEKGNHTGEATIPQLILSVYTVFLHILSIVFPIRVCWAMKDVLKNVREAGNDMPSGRRPRVQSINKEKDDKRLPVPLFVIILPAYKEEMATLEETLRVMASHLQARTSYHVYLAMEEKEEKSAFKAASLCATFERSFFKMSYTVHPSNIPGEAQGKSSNESWAAKQVMKDYPEDLVKQNTIITVMDADTHLSARYFTQMARLHTEHAETNETTIYVPPLVFDRNLHHVPLFVRTADLMWAGAGLSSLYSGSSVCIPTSVYSLPMTLVEHVGGWDTDPGAIGEDMHMYLKCFFALSGNLKVQIVHAAASQCNVSSGQGGITGYYLGLEARYKQALRHMWGSLDTGFTIRESIKMLDRHRKAKKALDECPLSAPNSNWTAFYTSTGLHKSLVPKGADNAHAPPKPVHKYNLFTLYHRLFEAHFLPIHLAVILTTSSIYSAFLPSFLVPHVLKVALDFSGFCRLIGFCTMLTFFYLYERYHRLCVGLRKEEMRRAGMLEDMEEADGFTANVFQVAGLFEAALFPIGGFIFGAIPAMQAVLSHLFTDRLTYVVSLKPQLTLKPWRDLSLRTP